MEQKEFKLEDFEPATEVLVQVVDEKGEALGNLTLQVESNGDSEEVTTDDEGEVNIANSGEVKITLIG